VNFIGTTDAKDFPFRTNNAERMRLTSGGALLIGTAYTAPVAGGAKLDVYGAINTNLNSYCITLTAQTAISAGQIVKIGTADWNAQPLTNCTSYTMVGIALTGGTT